MGAEAPDGIRYAPDQTPDGLEAERDAEHCVRIFGETARSLAELSCLFHLTSENCAIAEPA